MNYQLILQFPEKLFNFDYLVQIEEDLTQILKDDEFDGHDVGSGEINFIILTNKPDNAFKSLKQYLVDKELFNCVKAAYRTIDGETFTVLYPASLKKFSV